MKVAFFDTHKFERPLYENATLKKKHTLNFFEVRLSPETARLIQGHNIVCSFVNDNLKKETLEILKIQSVQLIALRSAGFNHIDLKAAATLGIKVVRVPEYSPHAVAEHAVALILSLNRHIPRAHNRVRENNFSLDGLVGFDLYKKTVGLVGVGRIGSVMAQIMNGFGCRVIAVDPNQSPMKSVEFVDLPILLRESDIISLHAPLTNETRHLINMKTLAQTKKGMMLINTGRGGLIETKALIAFLKNQHIGAAGLDVYEEEEGLFFEDCSEQILQDDTLARLQTFPNVLITSHQAFLTHEALQNIAQTTWQSIDDFAEGRRLIHKCPIA